MRGFFLLFFPVVRAQFIHYLLLPCPTPPSLGVNGFPSATHAFTFSFPFSHSESRLRLLFILLLHPRPAASNSR
jgi:hypothetical protein